MCLSLAFRRVIALSIFHSLDLAQAFAVSRAVVEASVKASDGEFATLVNPCGCDIVEPTSAAEPCSPCAAVDAAVDATVEEQNAQRIEAITAGASIEHKDGLNAAQHVVEVKAERSHLYGTIDARNEMVQSIPSNVTDTSNATETVLASWAAMAAGAPYRDRELAGTEAQNEVAEIAGSIVGSQFDAESREKAEAILATYNSSADHLPTETEQVAQTYEQLPAKEIVTVVSPYGTELLMNYADTIEDVATQMSADQLQVTVDASAQSPCEVDC